MLNIISSARPAKYCFTLVLTLSLLASSIVPSCYSANQLALLNFGRKAKASETAPALPSPAGKSLQPQVKTALGKLPVSFEANRGQADSRVKYLARGNGYSLFLTATEAVLSLQPSLPESQDKSSARPTTSARKKGLADQAATVRMRLIGSNSTPRLTGLDELPGESNYFFGNDPKKWRTNISNYTKVKYNGIYPGIDLVYYGSGQHLEYDFVVSPGANPNDIGLEFSGAKKVEVDAQGNLMLHTGGGVIQHRKPVIYQEVSGAKQVIPGRYILRDRKVRFQVDNYDTTEPLVIDPAIVYSTYLGGGLGETNTGGIAVYADPITNNTYAYVLGTTASIDFPTKNALQPNHNSYDICCSIDSNGDLFLTKFNMAASGAASVVFSTFLGGSKGDLGVGIAVDSSGNPYLTGFTSSGDFPVLNAIQTTNVKRSAFITKVKADGSGLLYSTYLGGNEDDFAYSIAVDGAGNAYVAGHTSSTNFPMQNALRTVPATMFVSKIAPPTGTTPAALVYSTYLGGTGSFDEYAYGIATDSSGNAYVTGITSSFDFPVTANAFQSINRTGPGFFAQTGFVTKINTLSAGSPSLLYSTYFGGSEGNEHIGCHAIAVDSFGNVYVTGTTISRDLPTTANSFKPTTDDDQDAFVAKFDTTKSGVASLVYSTYLGGRGGRTGFDIGSGITTDSAGNAYVTGVTSSADFPLVNPAQTYSGGLYQTIDEGGTVTKLNDGLTNNFINALVVDTSTVPRTLYIATLPGRYLGGIFKSTDGGNNWSPANSGLPNNTNVTILSLDPTNPATIYAGTTGSGIYKSTDGGNNWSAINNGLGNGASTEVTNLTFDTTSTSQTLYAGTVDNLYKSTDGGNNWLPTGLNNNPVSLYINTSTTPHTLYTDTQKSIDGGNSWTSLPTLCFGFDEPTQVLGIDNSTTPATIYANDPFAAEYCGSANFLKSTDNGTTWQGVFTGEFSFGQLIIDTNTSPSALYAISNGINKSIDGGSNWTRIIGGVSGPIVVDTNSGGSTNPPTLYFVVSGFERNVFVTKINPTGSALLFSTFLGGIQNNNDHGSGGRGIALDSEGNIYVIGATGSSYYPVLNALQPTRPCLGCTINGFVTKLGSASLPSSSSSSVTNKVIVQSGTLEMTFPNITGSTGAAPTITVNPLDSTTTANLTLSNNLGAYEIKTTATYDTSGYASDPTQGIKLTFTVPTVNDPTVFNGLVVTHGEDQNGDGIIQPAEMIPYNGMVDPKKVTYHDFSARTVWVYVPSLSPFIIVKGAMDQLNDLVRLVKGFNLKAGIENSLDAKLQNALKAYQAAAAKDRATACNNMGALLSEVQAQTGKALTQSQANQLVLAANQIKAVLGCR